ncbi:hypothetical protein HanPI659440_Chr15g0583111 [Helianthus annuus]|nr:hypothetical protein HanPI659440_Chr15g0583111 [Helianthus annuus]
MIFREQRRRLQLRSISHSCACNNNVFKFLHRRLTDIFFGVDLLNSVVYIFRNKLSSRIVFCQRSPNTLVANILLCQLLNQFFVLRRKPSRIRVTLEVFNRSVVMLRLRHLDPPNTSG